MKLRLKDIFIRYGLSLVVYCVAFFLTHLLWNFLKPAPVPLFFAAIVAAFWGGFGPGLFISIISALTIDFFFVPPFDHFEWTSQNLVRIGVFTTVSSLISWLNGTRKRLIVQVEGFNEELRREVALATKQLADTNDALLKTQQHLARSERMAVIGQMAGSLAHEIGSPLNAISGHLEFIGDIDPNDTELRRRIRIIRQQLDFIVGTVRRLLEWTHKRKLICAPTNILDLIREVLLLVGPALEKHSIVVTLRTETQVPILEVDSERLQHVFLNLLNNSIDAMPQGGTIDIVIKLADSGRLEILFKDSGVGIEPATAERLFEPMWTTKPSGSGFGLAIARETMNDHGGDIHVLENVSQGACFVLTIPLVRPAEAIEAEVRISNVA